MPPRKKVEQPNTTSGQPAAEPVAQPVGNDQLPPPPVKGERKTLARKPTKFQALRWTGHNQAEVLDFAGPDPIGEPAAVFGGFWDGEQLLNVYAADAPTGDNAPRVWVGNWIVKGRDGALSVHTDQSLGTEFDAA